MTSLVPAQQSVVSFHKKRTKVSQPFLSTSPCKEPPTHRNAAIKSVIYRHRSTHKVSTLNQPSTSKTEPRKPREIQVTEILHSDEKSMQNHITLKHASFLSVLAYKKQPFLRPLPLSHLQPLPPLQNRVPPSPHNWHETAKRVSPKPTNLQSLVTVLKPEGPNALQNAKR